MSKTSSLQEDPTRKLVSVEVTVRWGSSVLALSRLTPPRAFAVGTSSAVDFVVPEGALDRERLPLVDLIDGEAHVVIPATASATRRRASSEIPPHPEPFASRWAALAFAQDVPVAEREATVPGAHPLVVGDRWEIELGGLLFVIRGENSTERLPRELLGQIDLTTPVYFGLGTFVHAVILATAAWFSPPLGLTEDEAVAPERLRLIQQYLTAAAEREQKPVLDQTPGGAPAEPEELDLPEPMTRELPVPGARLGRRSTDPAKMTRGEAIAEAAQFGMVEIVNQLGLLPTGFANGTQPDHDAKLMGSIFGLDIGEPTGFGGLMLSGVGNPLGGLGRGVHLEGINTCRGADCAGLTGGFGRPGKGSGPGHATKVPSMRPGETILSGHMPPAVIQRVVRQNFGRFRQCYETGLRNNPSLTGRVATRFLIQRDGTVSSAQNAGSDLPDSGVVDCVVSTYYAMTFPAPESGSVRVTYPIHFIPEG